MEKINIARNAARAAGLRGARRINTSAVAAKLTEMRKKRIGSGSGV